MKTALVVASLLAAGAARADKASFCKQEWGAAKGCFNRRERPWRPVFTAALDFGASHFNEGGPAAFHDGFGNVTTAGGVWGARIGVDFFSWLGLEARYLGMFNELHQDAAHNLSYTTSAGIFDVRIGIPIPYVHPYVFSGIGVYTMHLNGSAADRTLSPYISSTQPGVPIGAGIDVPLNWHFSLAVEATYHFQFGESFARTSINSIDGGDFSTVTGMFRVRL